MSAQGVFDSPHFSISKRIPANCLPLAVRPWIRNEVDERAAQEGADFDERKGQFAVDWVENYCHLYQGSKDLMILEDWQYEAFMQIFGWQIFDKEKWNEWIRRFKTAHIWIPKKNGKSPTAAAMGLYMLCAENEPGQKCFSAAHDGEQAKIAHEHALNMVRASPDLEEWAKVDNGTWEIKWHPNQGSYSIVTGKNYKSTQGLNGSVFIDELHVVDEKLYDSLKYAGASRKEPLLATFSTAGDDITSIGYQIYKKSLEISRGKLNDQRCYVMIFGDMSADWITDKSGKRRKLVQDDLYDEEVAEKILVKSNPTLGRILMKTDLMNDYRDSKRTRTEFSRLCKYRGNQWTAGDLGWIHPDDWMGCYRQFLVKHMKKWPVVLGVDLSRTGDLTSITATWSVETPSPEGQSKFTPWQWSWSWIPEATAKRRADAGEIHYDQYVNDTDCLTIVQGAKTVPYNLVEYHIGWIRDNFDLRGIGYDAWNAPQLINDLLTNYYIDPSLVYKIPQTMSVMGPLSSQFEKDVLDKNLVHNGSEFTLWQMGNVQLHTDLSGNTRPIKPKRGDFRTIDNVVSAVMSSGMFYLPEFGMTNRPISLVSCLEPGTNYAQAS